MKIKIEQKDGNKSYSAFFGLPYQEVGDRKVSGFVMGGLRMPVQTPLFSAQILNDFDQRIAEPVIADFRTRFGAVL